LCREALVNRRPEYFNERLLRLSMREYSLDDFWNKKEIQYLPFRQKYRGLFDPRIHRLLRSVSHAIIGRNVSVANAIIDGWEQGPDGNRIWRARTDEAGVDATERIRRIPREILGDGIAITWPAIAGRIKDQVEISKYRPVLQNVYFSAYLREYELKVITNLPYISHPFVVIGTDLAYDYDGIKAALGAIGIWEIVRAISAPSMIDLRSRAGYIRFRKSYDTIAAGTDRVIEIRSIFKMAAEERKPSPGFLPVIERNRHAAVPEMGTLVPEPEMDEIADRLSAVGEKALELARDAKDSETGAVPVRRKRIVSSAKPNVAIFVALEMERKLLVDRWKLEASGLDQIWRGELGGARVCLFSRDEMGRVPAAIATMQFLQSEKVPDLLLVTGIAGGFEQEQVLLGDLLIPTNIIDLASRKIYSDKRTIPEFRPRSFDTDDRLARYLRASFRVQEWEPIVIKEAEWPEGRRPAIRYGPMVSLDEVVADTEFVKMLCNYWPKLLGVEMEAGGVCAAAAAFDIKAAVIRCVSDLADPSKSDNEWRRRAMKTVAHLIERIDFRVLAR